jgi:hypothetical protein
MGQARRNKLFRSWMTLAAVSTFAVVPMVSIAQASQRSQASRPSRSSQAAPAPAPAASAPSAQEYVVTIAGSKEYHRPDCPLVQKTAATAVMLRSQAEGKGLKPHKDCDPANAPAGGKDAVKPELVYIQPNDNKYHRAGCKLLGKEARRVTLDKDVVRGRWPCTTCRPPILTSPKPAF